MTLLFLTGGLVADLDLNRMHEHANELIILKRYKLLLSLAVIIKEYFS